MEIENAENVSFDFVPRPLIKNICTNIPGDSHCSVIVHELIQTTKMFLL